MSRPAIISSKRFIQLVFILFVTWLIKYRSDIRSLISPRNIIHSKSRTELLLFVAVYSAPRHADRRNAGRDTWMRKCKSSDKFVCWFITDGQDSKGKRLVGPVRTRLENESRLYGDVLLAESPGGANFARRYIWMAQWATERYNFQYLLRVDDDYFICIERLLLEMEFHRPRRMLQWGWLHCDVKGGVAIDEGFLIVTKDISDSILNRTNTTLPCHPFGGQAMGMWLNDVSGVKTFGDNKRIFHLSFDKNAAKRKEVCKTALAIHKSYPKQMKLYWNISQKEQSNVSYIVPPISFPCRFPRGVNYKVYGGKWFAKPILCKDNPVWDRGFKGRNG